MKRMKSVLIFLAFAWLGGALAWFFMPRGEDVPWQR